MCETRSACGARCGKRLRAVSEHFWPGLTRRVRCVGGAGGRRGAGHYCRCCARRGALRGGRSFIWRRARRGCSGRPRIVWRRGGSGAGVAGVGAAARRRAPEPRCCAAPSAVSRVACGAPLSPPPRLTRVLSPFLGIAPAAAGAGGVFRPRAGRRWALAPPPQPAKPRQARFRACSAAGLHPPLRAVSGGADTLPARGGGGSGARRGAQLGAGPWPSAAPAAAGQPARREALRGPALPPARWGAAAGGRRACARRRRARARAGRAGAWGLATWAGVDAMHFCTRLCTHSGRWRVGAGDRERLRTCFERRRRRRAGARGAARPDTPPTLPVRPRTLRDGRFRTPHASPRRDCTSTSTRGKWLSHL